MASRVKSDTAKLFKEYSQTKDLATRNELVERYLYMVDILAKKYVNKGVDYDDLYQVGSMALVFAVERFDPDKGFEFTSFATPTIIGEIKRYFRDKGWAIKVPRKWKEISAKIPNAKESLSQKLGRAPLVSELADYLDVTEEEVLEAMESGQAYGTFSLQQTFDETGNEGESPIFERFTAKEELGYTNFENSEIIKQVMETFSDQEKKVFAMRFFADKTQQEIANEIGVSQMTVSRMEKKLRSRFREEYNK